MPPVLRKSQGHVLPWESSDQCNPTQARYRASLGTAGKRRAAVLQQLSQQQAQLTAPSCHPTHGWGGPSTPCSGCSCCACSCEASSEEVAEGSWMLPNPISGLKVPASCPLSWHARTRSDSVRTVGSRATCSCVAAARRDPAVAFFFWFLGF